MNRIKLINLATFFCIVMGITMLVVGFFIGMLDLAFSGVVMIFLSGVIVLIGNELLAIRKSIDRLDRGDRGPRG